MYRKIAEYLYKLLVVNSYAAAIQQEDGRYITKYFPLSPFVIEEMIKQNGSMGCYQQGYKNNRIKWICFDFDCPDKKNPDVITLYKESVFPFTVLLNELSISYMTEFSGRRGIHVWIIFDKILSKEIGFQIICELKKRAKKIFDNPAIHVDFYPATDSAKGNVVGKQVKFPLSCHRAGGRSFLFLGEFQLLEECYSDEFMVNQLKILESHKPNDPEYVVNALGIDASNTMLGQYKYKKYALIGNIDVPLNRIEEILSETLVYKEIFSRMKQGQARREDWSVLFGTLVYCDDNCDVVKKLFSTFPNYDIDKTLSNIEKLSDKYFPATFSYLYQIYMLEPEEWLDLNETGLVYLLKKLECSDTVLEKVIDLNEHISSKKVQYTLFKEKNYLLDNDEVPDVLIWNKLNAIKPYDLKQIEKKVNDIKNGEWVQYTIPKDLVIYVRIESEEKTRKMVSLSAMDRILTTHMMLVLYSYLKSNLNSYSYNVSPCSKENIFYAWYSSWMNYITKVQTFLSVPFLNSFHVFVMDIKGFYDHIDFLAVYQAFEKNLRIEAKNIIQFLVEYNENVMKVVNGSSRYGVPQGPAYARVIAEAFLDYILQSVFDKYDRKSFYFYRYVDDMVIFYKPEFDGKKLYNELEDTLLSFGLPLNQEKSGILGSIKYLTEEEKNLISHKDKFSYDLQMKETEMFFEEEQNQRFRRYLQNNDFDISVVSYIFGKTVMPKAGEGYYKKYASQIFSENLGRGSYFKKFYQYLFKHEKLVEEALEKAYFFEIPIDSLNFSNFVHNLYLGVQNTSISHDLFKKIQKGYLEIIKEKIVNERDASVVEALHLLGGN